MQVFALIGPSGAGKSTSALSFAYEKSIEAIIDDGLLIFRSRRVAGTSAKFEKNMIAAVKRATFYFEDHAEEVKNAVKYYNIEKILLIGTSTKMVDVIALKLHLEKIDNYIDIKNIRSSSEIKLAMFTRNTKGDHLMPIPFQQVEQSFFRKIVKRGIKIFTPKKVMIGETTVVRPNFHKDSLTISNKALKSIVWNVCSIFDEIASCEKISVKLESLPIINVELRLYYLEPVENLVRVIERIQQHIGKSFNTHLNLDPYSVDICILKLI